VNNDPFLHGEIIVRADSKYKSLADLKGRCLAFTDPISTMAVLPLAMLREAGVPQSSLRSIHYLEGQRNVAIAVLADDCDAGAVKEELFNEYEKDGLRSLATTPPVYDFVFVASSTLPRPILDSLHRLLLGLTNSAQGRKIMAGMQPGMTALVDARDSDYDLVRQFAAGSR
jgi:phosphonate transport system substrate-binding protein